MDYKALHEKIMSIDSNIRLVTICDMDEKIIQTGHRDGVTNILTPEESKRSLHQAVSSWQARFDLAAKIGEGNYVLAVYDRMKRITIPLAKEHLIFITTEVDADHDKIIQETMKKISDG